MLSGICGTGAKLDLWDHEDVRMYVGKSLDMRGRRITQEQMEYIGKSLGSHCTPLVAQLVLHEAASWPSYLDGLESIPIRSNADFLTDKMLEKLERKHGEVRPKPARLARAVANTFSLRSLRRRSS